MLSPASFCRCACMSSLISFTFCLVLPCFSFHLLNSSTMSLLRSLRILELEFGLVLIRTQSSPPLCKPPPSFKRSMNLFPPMRSFSSPLSMYSSIHATTPFHASIPMSKRSLSHARASTTHAALVLGTRTPNGRTPITSWFQGSAMVYLVPLVESPKGSGGMMDCNKSFLLLYCHSGLHGALVCL